MNKIIILLLIVSCSTVGRKNENLKYFQVGNDFMKKPIQYKFITKYPSYKGITKTQAKNMRKDYLERFIHNVLSSVYNLGSSNLTTKGYYDKESITRHARETLGSNDFYKSILKNKFSPFAYGNSVFIRKDMYEFKVHKDKEGEEECSIYENRYCYKRPSTLIYKVNDSHSGLNASSLILGGLAYSENKIAVPSYKIHRKHDKYISSISPSTIINYEKKFFKKYKYLNITEVYQKILNHQFVNCEKSRTFDYIDIEYCITQNSQSNSIYPDETKISKKKLMERMAINDELRFNYWGILYLLNSDITIKRISKSQIQIKVSINTPHLYKNIKSRSSYIE